MKIAKVIITTCAISTILASPIILADLPDKERKEAYKERMKDEREQNKRHQELEREERKRYET